MCVWLRRRQVEELKRRADERKKREEEFQKKMQSIMEKLGLSGIEVDMRVKSIKKIH